MIFQQKIASLLYSTLSALYNIAMADTDMLDTFTPDEAKKLLKATKAGDALGAVIRVALLTGVRLEEVVSLEAS